MKFIKWILIISFCLIIFYCNSPTSPDKSDNQGDNKNVLLEIYSPSDTSGMIIQKWVSENEKVIIDFGEYSEYTILAKSKGFYTEFYKCNKGDTININLEPVDDSKYSGTLFLTSDRIPINIVFNQEIFIIQNGDTVSTFKSDSSGHFLTERIEYGLYTLSTFKLFGVFFSTPIIIDTTFQNIFIEKYAIARKPNIYIYPEEDTHIELYLNFPNGGYITESIPFYADGWEIDVTTTGKIDDKYDYLFYECNIPDYCQYQYGWVVMREDLKEFFEKNMRLYGFNDIEIGDFIDFWISRLRRYKKYIIYPQLNEQISNMVAIRISNEIDNINRLFYGIKGTNFDDIQLSSPTISEFRRDAFTIIEWGVILK